MNFMKLFGRFLLFFSIAAVITLILYFVGFELLLPWLMSFKSGPILFIGLITYMWGSAVIYMGAMELMVKLLERIER